MARILEYEADRFLGSPAPAQLYNDTQAESNAWTGGGIAVAACMLKSHPRQPLWAQKANEYMISAYATARDVESNALIDGRPLKSWLSGPNALADYTVENHGFVHPDYLAAISEMVRSAIAYRLADLPLPQAATFNAEQVFDLLAFLLLPDGSHLYPQGTDYTPRRLDSFFQACNVVPLQPHPLGKACLLRALNSLERMAAERPELPLNGWIGFPYDLGVTWGLTQNYLMSRLYGDGGPALPDDELETAISGVRVFESGQFAVHRTARWSSQTFHPSPNSWRKARSNCRPRPLLGWYCDETPVMQMRVALRRVWRLEDRRDRRGVEDIGAAIRTHARGGFPGHFLALQAGLLG